MIQDLPLPGQKPQSPRASLSTLSIAELLVLRQQVDAALPVTSLMDLNLTKELVIQLQIVQQLQADTLSDPDIPANQRAQCAGQVASVLTSLVKLQNEIFDSERLKRIEATLIEAVKELPLPQMEEFLQNYGEMLNGRA